MPKYILSISQKFDDMLTSLAFDEGVDKNEIIRTIAATYIYLKKETRKTGTKLALIDSDKNIIKELVMPWEQRG